MAHGKNCGCAMCGFCKKIGFISAKNDGGEGGGDCPSCGHACQEHKCPDCDGYHKGGGSCH